MVGFASIAGRSSKTNGPYKLAWYAYRPAKTTRTGMNCFACRVRSEYDDDEDMALVATPRRFWRVLVRTVRRVILPKRDSTGERG